MKITTDELKSMLARNDAIARRNPDLFGRSPGSAPSSPQPEPPVRDEPLATAPRKDGHGARYAVRITSHRVRLIDPDNLCAKSFVDCLRRSGLIPDDTAAIMDYSIRQQKAKTKEDQFTEIVIERLI